MEKSALQRAPHRQGPLHDRGVALGHCMQHAARRVQVRARAPAVRVRDHRRVSEARCAAQRPAARHAPVLVEPLREAQVDQLQRQLVRVRARHNQYVLGRLRGTGAGGVSCLRRHPREALALLAAC